MDEYLHDWLEAIGDIRIYEQLIENNLHMYQETQNMIYLENIINYIKKNYEYLHDWLKPTIPKVLNPTYYTVSYEQSDRDNTIWNKRLNRKWTPKPTIPFLIH